MKPWDANSRCPPVATEDLAQVIVAILENPLTHSGKTYSLCGPAETQKPPGLETPAASFRANGRVSALNRVAAFTVRIFGGGDRQLHLLDPSAQERLCAAEVFSAVSGSGASIFFEAGARAGVGANSLTAGAPSESDAVSEFCEEGTGFLCDYSLQGCPSVRQRQADSVAVPPRGRHVRSAGNLTRRIGNRHLQERGNGCGRMRRCALTPSCDSKSLPVNHGDLFRRETPPLGSLVTVAADEVQMACSALPDYSWMVAGLWPRGIGLWCVGRPRIRVAARNLCDDRGVARALFAVHGILLMAAAIGRGRLAREDIVGSWVGVVGLRSPQPEQSCRRFVCMPDWCVAPSRRGAVYVPPRRRSGPDGCTLVVGRRP
jgi:hypothetical protein